MAQSLITGKTTPGATVTVYWYGTAISPTINVSDGGAAKSNPITADADGSYAFWVDDGHYTIVNGTASGNLEIRPRAGVLNSFPSALDIAVLPFLGSTETNLGTMLEKLVAGSLSLYASTISGNQDIGGDLTVTGIIESSSDIATTDSSFTLNTGNGAKLDIGTASEEITLSTSGATTDSSANLLPSNALILGVEARVTTTITTATDWKVGDGTTAARFSAANSTLVAGTTSVGLDHWKGGIGTDAAGPTQTSAAKVRITTTGTPGAGKIRVTVFYLKFTAPTS